MTQTTTTGPITLADVRAALADTDPNTTNAAKLQKIIGRGSLATVQKHLEGIRAELAPVAPVAPGAAPAAPADAVAVIWGAAWAQAQALTLGRLEAVTVERDALAALTKTQAADLAALASEVDAGAETVATALADKQELEGKLLQIIQSSGAALQGHKAEIERLTDELERVQTAAQTAAALAERDRVIAAASMQSALDAQIQKYVDLKSVVDHLTPAKTKAH